MHWDNRSHAHLSILKVILVLAPLYRVLETSTHGNHAKVGSLRLGYVHKTKALSLIALHDSGVQIIQESYTVEMSSK